jgi:hypothetical protein
MRREATIPCTLVLLLFALPLAAGEPVPTTPPAPTAPPVIPDLPENQAELAEQAAGQLEFDPAVAVTPPPAVATARSAEMLEIELVINSERARVTELAARVRDLGDDAAALAVQLEIEQIKQGTEIEILRIQAKHARLAGREAQATAIEAALAQMLSPAPVLPASPTGDARR